MALQKNIDYVVAPGVQISVGADSDYSGQGCFVGTKSRMYLIPNTQDVDEGFWASVLSDTYKIESLQFGKKTPSQMVVEVLARPESTLESIHEFFLNLAKTWKSTQIVEISDLKNLKISTFCGGSVMFRKQGDLIYTPFIMSIGKASKNDVKNFFKDIEAQLAARK
ncbi:MAG: hypothetical protein LDLANPLL_00433 [Turneriella sp.]|nr:hypothetical protein [Turneriella sp.]